MPPRVRPLNCTYGMMMSPQISSASLRDEISQLAWPSVMTLAARRDARENLACADPARTVFVWRESALRCDHAASSEVITFDGRIAVECKFGVGRVHDHPAFG